MANSSLSSRTGLPRGKRRGQLRSNQGIIVDLAQEVRRTRVALGLTQSDLAGLSGTGVRFVVDLEHGKPTIELGKTLDVMTTLGLTFRVVSLQAEYRRRESLRHR